MGIPTAILGHLRPSGPTQIESAHPRKASAIGKLARSIGNKRIPSQLNRVGIALRVRTEGRYKKNRSTAFGVSISVVKAMVTQEIGCGMHRPGI